MKRTGAPACAAQAATLAALPPRRRSIRAGVSVPSAGVLGDVHDDVLEQVPDHRQHGGDRWVFRGPFRPVNTHRSSSPGASR